MANDDVPVEDNPQGSIFAGRSMNSWMKIILIALAVLVVAEIYSISRIAGTGKAIRAQNAKTRQELSTEFNNQLSARVMALEHANQEQLGALRVELDQASRHLGAQGGELRRARDMVAKLQTEHAQQVNDLKHEIALKADQQQLGALNADVSNTKTDLNKTKQNVDELASNFGMTRTRFGTLIARNHDEIDALRKLGERDYYEFTLVRHKPIHLASIGLDLKKTNKKHHTFTLDLLVDDVWVQKDHRTINEPIFFSTRGSQTFSELVVNKVDKDVISGYISTPKNVAHQMASRSGGLQ
jgi:Hyaluronan mediated motility receptor C-terminal